MKETTKDKLGENSALCPLCGYNRIPCYCWMKLEIINKTNNMKLTEMKVPERNIPLTKEWYEKLNIVKIDKETCECEWLPKNWYYNPRYGTVTHPHGTIQMDYLHQWILLYYIINGSELDLNI